MTSQPHADLARSRWITLILGGALLAVGGLLSLGYGAADLLAACAGTSGVVVLAVGIRGGRIAGRKPSGRIALIAVGVLVWGYESIAGALVAIVIAVAYGLGSVRPEVAFYGLTAALAFVALVALAAALYAGVRIGRAGVLRRGWAWIPLVVMVIAVAVTAANAWVAVTFALSWSTQYDGVYIVLALTRSLGICLVGIVAVVLALRERSAGRASAHLPTSAPTPASLADSGRSFSR